VKRGGKICKEICEKARKRKMQAVGTGEGKKNKKMRNREIRYSSVTLRR
jgi:hypothetical protein